MYHTTGFTEEQIEVLARRIVEELPEYQSPKGRPRSLSLVVQLKIALCFLPRNHVQQELAELFGVPQPKISRTMNRMIPVIGQLLDHYVPSVKDLDPGVCLIVDGTLVPAWSWADMPENYSGKHQRTGLNLQVACTMEGRLAYVSGPMPGSTHDTKALRASGFLDHMKPEHQIADRGYLGCGMITPHKSHVNNIRYRIERVIANLKTWRSLHTDYRRPVATHPPAIRTILALEFYRLSL
jgi:DDE superfamily endonuclease